jgi:hypothetical protein
MAVLDHVLGERGADRNLAIESTSVGPPSELSCSAVRIPRAGVAFEISVIEDDEGRCR